MLGFELTGRLGDQAAFVSAGGYHHHIGLNTWESRGGSPPPRGTTGLYHVAIRYPTRPALARALRALIERRYPIEGASDHAVSEAIYLHDPDGNGIELYWDRPRDEWPVKAMTATTRWSSTRWTSRACWPRLTRSEVRERGRGAETGRPATSFRQRHGVPVRRRERRAGLGSDDEHRGAGLERHDAAHGGRSGT